MGWDRDLLLYFYFKVHFLITLISELSVGLFLLSGFFSWACLLAQMDTFY